MSSRRHVMFALFADSILLSTPPARAQGLAPDVVNQAGLLRMHSQRLAKAWLAMAQSVEPERARKALADSSAEFERRLLAIHAQATQADIRNTYTRLSAVWREFKQALNGSTPRLADAPSVLALDGLALALAQQGTQQFEALVGRAGHLVNLAGRQRMLSQRMAKFRLACVDPAQASVARSHLQTARQEFTQALGELERAPESTLAIQEQLTLARGQWLFFEQSLLREGAPSPREASDVFVSSENILLVMDRITSLFARQGA